MTTTLELNDGYTIDTPVISGESEGGVFDLYEDDGMFIFAYELFNKEGKERYSHLHPYDSKQAMEFIKEFMMRKT